MMAEVRLADPAVTMADLAVRVWRTRPTGTTWFEVVLVAEGVSNG